MRRRVIGVVAFVAVAGVGVALALTVPGGSAASAACPPPPTSSTPPPQGEVCRIWLDGRRLDLSNSAANDILPAVSSNGHWVAFLSNRGGSWHFYVVASGGGHLRQVSPAVAASYCCITADGQPVWSPDGTRFVAVSGMSSLSVLGPGLRPRTIHTAFLALNPQWSPDGRLVALDVGTAQDPGTEVVGPTGKRIFQVTGRPEPNVSGWSSAGLLAVNGRRIRVFDERGRMRLSFPGRGYAWSPDGHRLASIAANRVEVRTLTGRVVLRRIVPGLHPHGHNGITWCGPHSVDVGGIGSSDRSLEVDASTGRVTPGSNLCWAPRSPNGKLVIDGRVTANSTLLQVSRPDGTHARTVLRYSCADTIENDAHWFPDGRSLIVDYACN